MRSAGETKACDRCGARFPRRSGGVRYCGDACRLAVQAERRAAAKAAATAATDKLCRRCDERKPKTEFNADARRRDGLFPYCNGCRRAYTGAQPVTKDPRTKQEYDRDRRAAMSAAERSALARRTRLAAVYNLTIDEYLAIFERQGGRCAICRREETATSSKYGNAAWLAVDHDHSCCPGKGSCGKCIRGLLCLACNTAVGALREDPDVMQAALDYVRKGGMVGWQPPYRGVA